MQFKCIHSRDRLGCNFMTVVRQTLNHIIIAILVREKESASQRTIVRIQTILGKYLLIMIEVVMIYRTIECHYYHLWRLE